MLHIEILSERLLCFAFPSPVKYMYANPPTIKTQVVHHSGIVLSECLHVRKNVQQQSRMEADENKEQTATEKRLHIQASDSITLCGIT